MKSEWTWRRGQPVIVEYLAAVLFVVAAAIVTAGLRKVFPAVPGSLFFCAVMLSAWRGGLGPGLLASILSSAAIIYWLPPPSLAGPNAGSEIPRFLVFLLASFFISRLCGQQRRSQAALQQARDELEQRVKERTQELQAANEGLKTEIAERKRTATLLDGQKRVLEMIAADLPLSESLDALIHLIEAQVPGMLGSILLIDEQGVHLRHGAAPSLPPEYRAAIDGGTIGPESGSCGTAACRKEAVMVQDIATDPLWKDYRAAALPHGLRACWSTPIFAAERHLLGTFAMYYRQPALPEPEHLRLIEMTTHIAAIAICRHQAQAKLHESEAKLKEAERIANIGYWERDLTSDRLTRSEGACRIFGLQPQNRTFSEAQLQEQIHPDDRQRQRQALAEAVAGIRCYDVEFRIVRPDGAIRFVHVRDEIVCDDSGRPIRMFGTVQDITECKQAEAALYQSEQRLHSLVNTAPIAIIYCDAEGFLQAYNPKAAELWGRSPSIPDPKERYCGSYRIYNADGTPIPLSANAVARVLQSGKAELNWEVIIERPDGTKAFAISSVAPLKNAQGQITGAVACIVDITERKQAENLLHAQAQEIKAIVENSPDPIIRFDGDLRRTYVNPAFIKVNGVPREALLGRKVGSAVEDGAVNATGEEVKILESSLKQVFDTGRPLDFEATWPRPSDRTCYAVHLEPEFDARGTLTSVLSIARDITERKHAEEALRESQQLLHLVLATLPVGVVVTDRAGDIVLANAASKRIWGDTVVVSGRERWVQSKGFWHGSGERIAPENWASARALSKGETSLNELIDIETYDGQRKTIQNSSAPIHNAEGGIVGAVIVNEDVTERVRVEDAVRKAEDNLRFVLDATPAMVHTARPDGYLDYFNQRWLDYVGLPLEGLQGWAWMSVIHPEDVEGEVKRWRACVASGEPFDYEVRMRRADGIYRWVLHRKVAVRDKQGNIVKWCGSSLDIDDRKKAERLLRDSHAQLRALSARLQSVREEEATRIAREIHDDLGQQLTGLKMDLVRAERKLEKLESSPTVNALLDTIVNATELADSMIARVQEIAANLRPEMLDKLGLSAALRYESRRFQERTGVSCEARLPETELNLPPEISTTLFRILQECLTNIARHALATRVEVELKQEEGWVTLRVEDNGRGITEAEIANAQSLGLLGMKERTALLGGEIAFYGGAGGGTIVNASIPLNRTLVQAKAHA